MTKKKKTVKKTVETGRDFTHLLVSYKIGAITLQEVLTAIYGDAFLAYKVNGITKSELESYLKLKNL